ncbi:flavodoxin family protein [Pseudoclavibacter sp. VKM Ac-2888]|uniref:flavodoxin family protein n=1 Tax=Pseudoclavibacter sp. VKM Ac-2888 TaxID=2783830 RepID=UPI00188D553F|nr:NAD(P)H-dependent oxidoreductase [Pseudoclavibacter sp. VKM Ac-2888]MBF4551367.1 NAD(P)H-dependent oxidoreductase [Pseudoclavibacter sp. VKM Ac-2888]
MKILAIHSSPRPRNLSHTAVMLEASRSYLAERRPAWRYEETALWNLEITTCDGNGRCFRRDGCTFVDDAESLIDAMLAADGVILASPNYCANVNSTMMRFIERTTRLSHRQLLAGKGALAMSTSASPFDAPYAAEYLRRVLGSYGASVVDVCNIGSPMIVFDYGDTAAGKAMRASLDAFVSAVESPSEHVPEETFGVDIRRSLREHPEVAKRLFRSDERYFAEQDRTTKESPTDDASH